MEKSPRPSPPADRSGPATPSYHSHTTLSLAEPRCLHLPRPPRLHRHLLPGLVAPSLAGALACGMTPPLAPWLCASWNAGPPPCAMAALGLQAARPRVAPPLHAALGCAATASRDTALSPVAVPAAAATPCSWMPCTSPRRSSGVER
uniref:Uncharacterized protein n=1 Tax=Setaria viridis TaxID=4556 RepID=A0A4V6D0S6_SETVI|nr:hypothetical protein SEVIR_9G091400v2 [Setaria viridis]